MFNQDTAGILARVERGETIEITRHGRVIGRIIPATPGEPDDLIAVSKVSPTTVTGPFVAPKEARISHLEAGELIRQPRDEEPW